MSERLKELDNPREWLDRAKSNFILAKSKKEGVFLEDLCFDAQQAVEKAAKALLIDCGVDYPYTHDLAELLTLLKENTDLEIPELVQQIPKLTRYAVAVRYPGPLESVTEEEYEQALIIAEEMLTWTEEIIDKGKKGKEETNQSS